MLRITIPGEPVAQGRPRFARRGRHVVAYDPDKSRDWKATAQAHMLQANDGIRNLMTGPLWLTVRAYFTCPKSDHRKREPMPRRWHTKRPDADNIAKAVKDAGSGVLWLDDSQVCQLTVEKWIAAQGEAPRVEVYVQEWTHSDNAGADNSERGRA